MACIRKRRGKYVVDYRDPAQKRRWVTCDTRRQAEAVYAEVVRVARQPTRPVVDPDITVADYAAHGLGQVTVTVKRRTRDIYQGNLRRHILPALGALKVTALDRGRLKAFLAAKLAAGLSRAPGRNTSESPPSLDAHRKRQLARRSDAGEVRRGARQVRRRKEPHTEM